MNAATYLGGDARRLLRSAFRAAGFNSPSMDEIATWYAELLEAYLSARNVPDIATMRAQRRAARFRGEETPDELLSILDA